MRTRIFGIALSLVALSTLAVSSVASARVVAESETGMVFGDLNCRFTSLDQVKLVKIAPDYFDYLTAVVKIDYTCVTRDGRHWARQGSDVVEFLTPEFNWETQAWETNGTWLAEKVDELHITQNPELDIVVWTDARDEGIAFKVQYKTIPQRPLQNQ